MALSGVCIIETEKYFWFWLAEGVTSALMEIKDQVRLTLKLASNYFASLKLNK